MTLKTLADQILDVATTKSDTIGGTLTETIGGTHTLTSPTADITYSGGEITVAGITHTQHTHTEVPGTGGSSSPTPGTQETSTPNG